MICFKLHPDAVMKNTLTQLHSYGVISMASTNRWGLKSQFSSGFCEKLGVGSVDNPSETPTSASILWPTILNMLILIFLSISSIMSNGYLTNKQTNNKVKTITESLPLWTFLLLSHIQDNLPENEIPGSQSFPLKATDISPFSSGFS